MKEKRNKKIIKNVKGITLIALVVTVFVHYFDIIKVSNSKGLQLS